jgi:hypothetical protein
LATISQKMTTRAALFRSPHVRRQQLRDDLPADEAACSWNQDMHVLSPAPAD